MLIANERHSNLALGVSKQAQSGARRRRGAVQDVGLVGRRRGDGANLGPRENGADRTRGRCRRAERYVSRHFRLRNTTRGSGKCCRERYAADRGAKAPQSTRVHRCAPSCKPRQRTQNTANFSTRRPARTTAAAPKRPKSHVAERVEHRSRIGLIGARRHFGTNSRASD